MRQICVNFSTLIKKSTRVRAFLRFCCHRTIKTFPKGQKLFLSPFLFSSLIFLSKKEKKKGSFSPILGREEGMERRRKENSFLRLRFCDGRNGGENRNQNLILREGMFANMSSFCILYISLNFILLWVKQGRNGIEKGPCF